MEAEIGSMASRLSWFTIVAVCLAYTSYLVLGSIVNAQASGTRDPIVMRDELRANQHTLSGMVTVSTPCDELSVRTEALSQTSFALIFTTWHEPSVSCGSDATPRAFETVLFAPAAGVTFAATLDGKELPITVVPIVIRTR